MTREEQITEEFGEWLERYTPARVLQENEKALDAELRALVRAVLRFAPQADYLSWLERVTSQLDYQMKTRSWPTVSEVGAVASNVNKSTVSQQNQSNDECTLDPMKIAAKRMNAGEQVGDEWIYGRRAVEVMAAGLVHMDTMRKYRSALYFSAKKLYGEEKAKAMERDWIARHQSAEDHHRITQKMPEGEPFKRMPKSDADQWAAE